MKNKILVNARRIVAVTTIAVSILAPAIVLGQWGGPTEITQIATDSSLEERSFIDVIVSVMNWMLIVIGVLAVIMFIVAGIMYLTAAGDEDQVGKAKKVMTYAIIGLLVALLGLVIVRVINSVITGTESTEQIRGG